MITILLLFAAALPIAGAQSATAADLFESLHERSQARQATTRSLGARFTETTVSSLLTEPVVARGTIVAARPGRLIMKYASPDQRTVVVNGDRLVVSWPERHQREDLNIAETQQRIEKYFASASVKDLRGFFDIVAGPDPSVANTYRIDMTPRRKPIKQGLDRLEIWVDQDTVLMTRMRLTFPGGDTKTIQLDDVRTNVPAGDELFAVPAGAEHQ